MKGKKKESAYDQIRGNLIKKGTSLHRWAKANGYSVSSVYKAASGTRSGKVAKEIREKLKGLA